MCLVEERASIELDDIWDSLGLTGEKTMALVGAHVVPRSSLGHREPIDRLYVCFYMFFICNLIEINKKIVLEGHVICLVKVSGCMYRNCASQT